MIKGDYTIKIVVTHSDSEEVVCKGHSLNFESAGEELGRLERYIEKVEQEKFISQEDENNE